MLALTPHFQLLRTEKIPHIGQFTKLLKGACERSKQKNARILAVEVIIATSILNYVR